MANSSPSLIMNSSLPLQDFKPSVEICPFTTGPAELIGLDLYADVAGISLNQLYQHVKGQGLLSAAAEEGLRRRVEEQIATAGGFPGKNMVKNDVAAVVEKKKTNDNNVVVDQQEEEDYSSEMVNHKASRDKLIKRQRLQKSKKRPKKCGNIYSLLD